MRHFIYTGAAEGSRIELRKVSARKGKTTAERGKSPSKIVALDAAGNAVPMARYNVDEATRDAYLSQPDPELRAVILAEAKVEAVAIEGGTHHPSLDAWSALAFDGSTPEGRARTRAWLTWAQAGVAVIPNLRAASDATPDVDKTAEGIAAAFGFDPFADAEGETEGETPEATPELTVATPAVEVKKAAK